jgi:hypothetical protein
MSQQPSRPFRNLLLQLPSSMNQLHKFHSVLYCGQAHGKNCNICQKGCGQPSNPHVVDGKRGDRDPSKPYKRDTDQAHDPEDSFGFVRPSETLVPRPQVSPRRILLTPSFNNGVRSLTRDSVAEQVCPPEGRRYHSLTEMCSIFVKNFKPPGDMKQMVSSLRKAIVVVTCSDPRLNPHQILGIDQSLSMSLFDQVYE